MIARAPTLRAEFAQRLRRLRIERGYKRARHLAESLGIDENRYTRYERAETEPDISLLSLICSKLAVTPNTLLGFDGVEAGRARERIFPVAGGTPVGALHEPEHGAPPQWPMTSEPGPGVAGQLDKRRKLTWQLAEWAVHHLPPIGAQAKEALGRVETTAQLYASLMTDPFLGVGRIAGEASRAELTPEERATVERLIERILGTLATP